MIARPAAWPRPAVHLLFLLSGAAGLVYQIVWMRMLILVFGATAFAVSTVLTAFMGGLALGSWLLGRRADRGVRPLRLYGWLEIGIGVAALALPALFAAMVPIYRWIWLTFEPGLIAFSLLKFLGSLTLLLVPTTLMGGTLPVLARWVAERREAIGARVGVLYAVNTFGAVVGTLACGFLLIRFLGLTATILAAASLNILLGVASLLLDRRAGTIPSALPAQDEPGGRKGEPAAGRLWAAALLLAYAASGFAALLLEVAWTRILTLVIGGSVYAFTLMLTAFLIGLAGGAMALAPLADRAGGRRPALLAGLLAGAGGAALASLYMFEALPYLFATSFHHLASRPALLTSLKLGLCVAVMFPATFLLGGVFPVVLRLHRADLARLGRSVGEVYAANTAGTIVGAFAGGFLFIPLLGLQGTVAAAGALEIMLAAVVLFLAPGAGSLRRTAGAALAVAALLAAGPLRPAWNTLLMNSGIYLYAADLPPDFDRETFREYTETAYRELFYREGATATVLVAEERANGNIFLSVNGKVDASSGSDMQTQVLSGHLPALLHPDPRRALVVGLASGVTAGSLATHPVERVDVVEIEAAVVAASHYFDGVNNRPLDDPRVRPIVNDGRNYLLFTPERYDVIISEPSNPWLTGAANLFTREYFRLTAQRLAPAGISLQWIQAYNMALPDLKSLLATYHEVFPHVLLFNLEGVDMLLVGSRAPLRFQPRELARRMESLDVALDLARVGIREPADLMAWFAMGEDELAAFTAGAGPNTDDNARVEFAAPWHLFDDTLGANAAAMAQHASDPADYLQPAPDTASGWAAHHRAMARALARRGAPVRALAAAEKALRLEPDADTAELREALTADAGS